MRPELHHRLPPPLVQSWNRLPSALTWIPTVSSPLLFLLLPKPVLGLVSRAVFSKQTEMMSSALPDKTETWGPCTFAPQVPTELERVDNMVVFRWRTTGIGGRRCLRGTTSEVALRLAEFTAWRGFPGCGAGWGPRLHPAAFRVGEPEGEGN